MAIVVESVGLSPGVGSTTCVITAPTGIAVGDLLIAFFVIDRADTTITPASGFTLLSSNDNTTGTPDVEMWVYYKVADSGDAAASDFTFTFSGSGANKGSMLRISGYRTGGAFSSITTADSVTTTVTMSTITPANASGLLVLCAVASGVTSFSGYTCATSPPSFTEHVDVSVTSGTSVTLCVASGIRSVSTATGNCTITCANTQDGCGFAFFVESPEFTTTNADSSTCTDNLVSAIRDRVMSFAESLSLTDIISATKQKVWNTLTKNISTWINGNKT